MKFLCTSLVLRRLLVSADGFNDSACDATVCQATSPTTSDSKGIMMLHQHQRSYASNFEVESQLPSLPPETCSSTSGFGLQLRTFPVGENRVPHNPADSPAPGDFPFWAPKYFYPVTRGDRREGVVWADTNDNVVYMTWFESDLSSSVTSAIYTPAEHEKLNTVASNGGDAIMLLTVDDGNSQTSQREPALVRMIKVDSSSGSELKQSLLPDVNIWQSSIGGSMVWDTNTDTIAMMLSTFMLEGGDGLNHQSCFAILVDGSTLQMKQNYGQTSSHSVDNTIVKVGADDEFLGMDLSDAHLRGINVYRMTGSWKMDQRVYVMKNTNPGDLYVYTEMAHPGVAEVDDGFLVLFAGEQAPLDRTKLGSVMNVPRDLGVVKISKTTMEILSDGEETGHYYNSAGTWSEHTNVGIKFLTNQSSIEETITRVKTFSLNSSRVLLAYEVWTANTYVATEFLEIDANGGILRGPWRACFPMGAPKADDGAIVTGRAVMYAGGPDNTILRYEVCVDGSCTDDVISEVPAPSASPTSPYFTRSGLSPIAPEDCVDTDLNACNRDMCESTYWYPWALDNCPAWCGLCTPLVPPTPPPTAPPTPPPTIAPENCVDTEVWACNRDMCTDDYWYPYVRDKCPAWCGLCTPPDATVPPSPPAASYELLPLPAGSATGCSSAVEITTMQECNTAGPIAWPGVTVKGDMIAAGFDGGSFPRGCFVYGKSDVWFNSGSGGYAANTDSVCKELHDEGVAVTQPYELLPLPAGSATGCSSAVEITTLQECDDAGPIAWPGATTKGDMIAAGFDGGSFPRGCFIYGRSDVWFNSGSGGYADNTESVCKAAPTD